MICNNTTENCTGISFAIEINCILENVHLDDIFHGEEKFVRTYKSIAMFIWIRRYFYRLMKPKALVVFEGKNIRRLWHNEEWYFSVTDVVAVLTESQSPRQYWGVLKGREPQLLTFCLQLKLPSSDGKSYATDCANTKNMFRIIQTIPSQKAEPFKQWLAQV